MRSLKFRALVTTNPPNDEDSADHLPCSLVVRGHQHEPERVKGFNAMVFTDDDEPLRPGDTLHTVTMTVTDEDAARFLRPGERFELWTRHQVGHGVISRRVFV
jgi:hypothetical protein